MFTTRVYENQVLEALGFLDEGEEFTVKFIGNTANEEAIYEFSGENVLVGALAEFLVENEN